MPTITTGRAAAGGVVAVAALLAALLFPGREPAGLDEARAQAGVERIAGEGEGEVRCAATWGAKRHDGCYLAGWLRALGEDCGGSAAACPFLPRAAAEAEAYAAGCGPLPDPDSAACAASPFCRGEACAPRDGGR